MFLRTSSTIPRLLSLSFRPFYASLLGMVYVS